MLSKSICTSLGLAFMAMVSTVTADIHLAVSASGGNKSSPILYGAMFEDINQSGDGGIYAELIRNRAFQGSPGIPGASSVQASTKPGLHAYNEYGSGTRLSIDTTNPLSSALPNCLAVNVPNHSGTYGFQNQGFWGIPITPQSYHTTFYAKGAYSGNFQVTLKSKTGTIYSTQSVPFTGSQTAWGKHTARLIVTRSAPDVNNIFEITFNAAGLGGGANNLLFNMISLFPATYNNRVNGLRPDLMNALGSVKPSFLRWPGGNNLEGLTVGQRWQWRNTVGDLTQRPGRPGTWNYENTDGLGMIEYLLWTKDLGMKNLFAVWDGLALDGETVTGDALNQYITEALNAIEFIRGDKSTPNGKLRASLGYPEPFELEYVEIGNEDFLSGGLNTYAERLTSFYNAIHNKYPDIQLIASTNEGLPRNYPKGMWTDIHYYLRPDGFYTSFNLFDNWDRNYPTIVGEYACVEPNDPRQFNAPTNWTAPITDHFFQYPEMIGSVAEAIFMIGAERNSDVVKALAYAPALQNLNNFQWIPNTIAFSADPSKTVLSTSYWVQQMLSSNRGSTILPVKATGGGFDPSFWVASRNDATGEYFVKLAHYSAQATTITIAVPGVSGGVVTTLASNNPGTFNSVTWNGLKPWTSNAVKVSGGFQISLPAWSVVVVAFK